MKKIKRLSKYSVYFLCLSFICFCASVSIQPNNSANANSAQRYWRGGFSSIPNLLWDCPVEVESELLSFDIDKFPETSYHNEESISKLKDYTAKVSAKYTLYNPAEEDIEIGLAFPYGERPSYISDNLSGYIVENYSVSVNDMPIESKVRHTYVRTSNDFDGEKEVKKIADDYKEAGVLKPGAKVYRYEYHITNLDTVKNASHYEMQVCLKSNDNRLLMASANGYITTDNAPTIIFYVNQGDNIEIVSIGEPILENEITFKFVSVTYSFMEIRKNIKGTCTLSKYGAEETTLKEYILNSKNNHNYDLSQVSDIDLYNGIVDIMCDENIQTFLKSEISTYLYYFYNNSMRWLEYNITIPTKGRIVNEVVAPLYPNIDGDYSSAVYEYKYLLSPAKCWANFKNLEVKINTPYFMVLEGKEGFIRTDYGYTFKSENLPDGELIFFLSQAQNPTLLGMSTFRGCGQSIMFAGMALGGVFLIVFCILAVYALVAYIVIIIVKKNKKK